MDTKVARERLCGCYVTIPTMFRDDHLAVDLPAIRRHVRFLVEGGITTGTGVLLAGGAAGDFSTMTYDERLQVAEAVVVEANGRVPVVMGVQTTSTLELVRLARAAQRIDLPAKVFGEPAYVQDLDLPGLARRDVAPQATLPGIGQLLARHEAERRHLLGAQGR